MPITSDGFLDWAIRMQPVPTNRNTNVAQNSVNGIFFHSAEGYKDTLLNLAVAGPYSWHLSVMLDGTVYQHHPFTHCCWHASAANNTFIGAEHEGVHTNEPSFSDAQVASDIRIIKDVSSWRKWTPSRPISPVDTMYTLWEHKEVVKIGGSGTECPDGRVPWDKIMKGLEMPSDDDQIKALVALAHFIRNGWNLNDLSSEDKNAIKVAVERIPS